LIDCNTQNYISSAERAEFLTIKASQKRENLLGRRLTTLREINVVERNAFISKRHRVMVNRGQRF